jgi:hypothetical protein
MEIEIEIERSLLGKREEKSQKLFFIVRLLTMLCAKTQERQTDAPSSVVGNKNITRKKSPW